MTEFAPQPQPQLRRVRRRTPATTFVLTAIFAAFAIQFVQGDRAIAYGAIIHDYIFLHGEYWRLLTAMFLHGGVLHLAMNVIALVQIGRLYELMFGSARFLTVYFVSGLLASLASAWFTRGASVGASGAIFGILGAFVFSVWRSPRFRHERMARSIVNQLIFWIIANLIIGTQIPQIDMSAHVGGLLVGMLLGATLPHAPAPPPPPPAQAIIEVKPHDP